PLPICLVQLGRRRDCSELLPLHLGIPAVQGVLGEEPRSDREHEDQRRRKQDVARDLEGVVRAVLGHAASGIKGQVTSPARPVCERSSSPVHAQGERRPPPRTARCPRPLPGAVRCFSLCPCPAAPLPPGPRPGIPGSTAFTGSPTDWMPPFPSPSGCASDGTRSSAWCRGSEMAPAPCSPPTSSSRPRSSACRRWF